MCVNKPRKPEKIMHMCIVLYFWKNQENCLEATFFVTPSREILFSSASRSLRKKKKKKKEFFSFYNKTIKTSTIDGGRICVLLLFCIVFFCGFILFENKHFIDLIIIKQSFSKIQYNIFYSLTKQTKKKCYFSEIFWRQTPRDLNKKRKKKIRR